MNPAPPVMRIVLLQIEVWGAPFTGEDLPPFLDTLVTADTFGNLSILALAEGMLPLCFPQRYCSCGSSRKNLWSVPKLEGGLGRGFQFVPFMSDYAPVVLGEQSI